MRRKQLPRKTVYYTNEETDEFSSVEITPKRIDENWRYLRRGVGWSVKRFLSYRLLAPPTAYAFCRIKLRWQVKNKRVLKEVQGKKQGYFLYGNHTQQTADAFIPSLAVYPKSVYVIVHANNVSMPVLGRVNAYMGALPLPDTLKAAQNFREAVRTRYEEGNVVMIYPEAHIWPYYTGIRNFSAASFRYPAELNAPCFCMTTVYEKRKRGKRPRAVTYLDGPFYPDPSLPRKERAQALRDAVYETMKARSALGDCEYIRYERKAEES